MRKSPGISALFIIFSSVVACYTASAQSDYVVTIKGDTLRGKVKYFSYSGVKYGGSNSKYVQLTPESGKKTTHQLLQTISFQMNNEIYHTIRTHDGYTFMKLIKPGYLSLYGFQMENQTTWDGRYFVKKDGSVQEVPNIGFKKRLSQFLEDCSTVVNDIQSGTLGKSDLVKILDQYNACKDLNANSKLAKKSPAFSTWEKLKTKVTALPEFDKKNDALEMIRDIQNKISRNETVPVFLTNALKDALKDQTSVNEELNEALNLLGK